MKFTPLITGMCLLVVLSLPVSAADDSQAHESEGERAVLQLANLSLKDALTQINASTDTIILTSWASLKNAGIDPDQIVSGPFDPTRPLSSLQAWLDANDLSDKITIEKTSAFVRLTATQPSNAVKAEVKSKVTAIHSTKQPKPEPANRNDFDAFAARGAQMEISRQLKTTADLRAYEDQLLQARNPGLNDFQRAVIQASTRPGPAGAVVTQRPFITGGAVAGRGGAIGFDPEVSVVNDGAKFAGSGTASTGGRYVTLNGGASLVGNVEFRRVPIFFDTGDGRRVRRAFIEVPTASLVKSRSTVFAPAAPVSRTPLIYRPAKLR